MKITPADILQGKEYKPIPEGFDGLEPTRYVMGEYSLTLKFPSMQLIAAFQRKVQEQDLITDDPDNYPDYNLADFITNGDMPPADKIYPGMVSALVRDFMRASMPTWNGQENSSILQGQQSR